MSYVRLGGIACESCGGSHSLAIELPASPNQVYTFTCPNSQEKMLIYGFSTDAAKKMSDTMPADCIPAKKYVSPDDS